MNLAGGPATPEVRGEGPWAVLITSLCSGAALLEGPSVNAHLALLSPRCFPGAREGGGTGRRGERRAGLGTRTLGTSRLAVLRRPAWPLPAARDADLAPGG